MKDVVVILLALFCFLGSTMAAEKKDFANGLKVVKAMAHTDRKGKAKNDLVLVLYVKNISGSTTTVLTNNLQASLLNYTDKPKEIYIDLSTTKRIDDQDVVPSLPDLSPVILNPGEIAEIKHRYTDRKNLEEVVLVYDMLNKWTERFTVWRERIRSEPVRVQ